MASTLPYNADIHIYRFNDQFRLSTEQTITQQVDDRWLGTT